MVLELTSYEMGPMVVELLSAAHSKHVHASHGGLRGISTTTSVAWQCHSIGKRHVTNVRKSTMKFLHSFPINCWMFDCRL